MAQTNFTPISLYYSPTAAAVPVNTNLVAGELALNTNDEKLYFKNSAGVVKLLASSAATAATPVTTITFGSTGLTPSTATSGAVTVAGTLVAANGGTGFSSYTVGDIFYASGTTTLSKLAASTSGYVLRTNGAGTAPTWVINSGGATGGGTDQVFVENQLIVTTSYTLTTGKSAMSVGPITINGGVAVTIPAGYRWVVL
jgi:hypothetical protein